MLFKSLRIAALSTCFALPLAHAALADSYHVITTEAGWEVGTGTDDNGNAYCSAKEQSDDNSYGLGLYIYPEGNSPSFELHVFNDQWSVPASADVDTKFHYSNGGDWEADGSAASDHSTVVDYTIPFSKADDFMSDFAASDTLEISFVTGTEPDWTVDLTGTAAASSDLLDCAKSL
jgi:hypothetical protein